MTEQVFVACTLAVLLTNCSSLERLRNIGEQPTLDAIQNPTTRAGYKPVQMPMPAPQPAIYQPNSLWRTGSRAFFKDQRANQVGDILTVQIKITDRAQFENETQRSRKNRENSGVDNFIGSKAVSPTSAICSAVPHPDRRLQRVERRQGLDRPQGRTAHQPRRRGDAGAAERQPGDRGQAGDPRQLRSARADRRRHRPPGRYPERQHHRVRPRSPRRASPMAAAARSPTCSSRATANRCSTCCCRSIVRHALANSSPPFLRAQWDGVDDAASGSSPPEAALALPFPRRRQVM